MPSFAGGKERALRIKDKVANIITRVSGSNLLDAFGGIAVGVTDPLLPPPSDTSEPHVDVWVPEDESELSVSPNQLNFLALKRGGFILICRRSAVRVTAMKNGAEEKKLSRECLISTGATAPFPALIAAVLGEDCIQQFADLGYTKLVFQAGDALRYLYEIKPEKTLGVEIEAFDFNREGLTKQMKACIGRAGKSKEGLVICHAGSSTAST
jgi:beta-1,4-N-acetylglucosaminyltransferase